MDSYRTPSLNPVKSRAAAIIGLIILAIVIVLSIISYKTGSIPELVKLLGGILLITCVVISTLCLIRVLEGMSHMEDKASRTDRIIESLEKTRSELMEINRNTRLSETVKAIAFRDADRQTLREVVYEKLQQQDFETANAIIEEIARSKIYLELVKDLREETERYKNASQEERINQTISQIERLLDTHQWAKASAQIERLIQTAPNSEKAKKMREKLAQKKEQRKKMLLKAWDESVKKQATDRSLEILRELDMYLTPNEGLALQEAAKDVFRNKLHNLGVQFSLAVSGHHWGKAVQTGKEIIHDFPNSRMAEEIRERMDVLKQKAQGKQQTT